MRWVGPDTPAPIGHGGPWPLAAPRPVVFGVVRLSDRCRGVEVAPGVIVARRDADPITGRPRESIDTMIERAAETRSDGGPWQLIYEA